jgi:hypothetical protein
MNTIEFIKLLKTFIEHAEQHTDVSQNIHIIEFQLNDGAQVTIEIK